MKKRPASTDLNTHIREMPEVQKLLHKRRVMYRSVRIFVSVLLIACCIGIVFFIRQRSVQIYTITVSGNEIIDSGTVVSLTQKTLSGKYLHLFPRTSIFFYPKNELHENLKKEFPRFETINISLVNKNNLSIVVTEEKGIALWCGKDAELLDMKAQCYFTDTEGKIIDRAPYYSGNVYLRFFGKKSMVSETNPLGQNFVDEDSFFKLSAFARGVQTLGFQIKAIRITEGEDIFFVLDLNGTDTAFVQFRSSDNYEILFSNLQTALSKTELSKQLASKKSNLQYFDLRFKNKVYYKFNDTVAPAAKPKQ
jgi:hypothetical protein